MAKETTRYGLLILATVSITYMTEHFLRSSPSALSPVLIEEFGLSHGVAGLLLSSYFFLYGLLQIPAGILSDTLGPRRTIIGFTVFTVLGTAMFYAATGFGLLVAAQLLIGLGSGVFYINAVRMVSNWFPPERQATAVGVLSASSGVGNFAAYMGFPLAVTYMGGWRTLYLYCCVLMVVNLAANFFILKNSPGGPNSVPGGDASSVVRSLRAVMGDRRIYPYLVGYTLFTFFWIFMSWLPQFLTDARGLSYIDVGLITSAMNIVGIPGCILVGMVSDRLRRRKLPLVASLAASSLLLIAFILLPRGTSPILYTGISAALGFTISSWVLIFSMVPETLPPDVAGIGLGLVNGVGTIGFALFTPLYGLLVDVTGGYAASNGLIMAGGVAIVLVFALFLKETYGGTG